ncbi:MAG: ShlB/FhaC/HecB family hemolysin secretion/activation protein [Magnetococcales bacterium]|nr:ShlB/FhaC/HecB family hemolysin secretion/activation protein [Magnetococcales bacterium]
MALSVGAFEAVAAPLDSGALMDTLQKPVEAAPKAPPAINLAPESDKKAPKRDQGVKVRVASYTVSGNASVPQEQLLPLLDSFKGREITFDDLNTAARRLTDYYREQGYFLATAYLPPQELTPNAKGEVVIQIVVVEGRLGQIQVKGNERLSEERARAYVEADVNRELAMQAKGLERGLLLLDDLPGVTIQSTLKPGKTPGTSDLDVVLGSEPLFTGSIDLSNHGSEYTGDFRGGLTLNVNSPLRIGDQLTLRTLISEDDMWFGRVSYTVPVNTRGTRVGAHYSQLDYDLSGSLSAIGGDGSNYGLFASHPFVRSRVYNLYGQLTWDHKQSEQKVAGIRSNEYEPDVFAAALTGDFRDGWNGGGLTAYELSFHLIDNDSFPTGYVGSGSDHAFRFLLSRLQRLPGDFSLFVATSGQLTGDDLISSEQFRLGGPTGVRAYPQGEGTGDSGAVLSVDLRYDLDWLGERLGRSDLQAVLFGDVGTVHLNTPVAGVDTNRTLSGVGVGLNLFNVANQFSVKWNAALQLDAETITSESRQGDGRTWIQAVKWF